MGPAQANALRPKRSKFTFGTSRSNPPAERSERLGACWGSSAARYSGVPSYTALLVVSASVVKNLTEVTVTWRVDVAGLEVADKRLAASKEIARPCVVVLYIVSFDLCK